MTTTPKSAPTRTGRPTHAEAAQLDERVREAALEVFLDRGFDRATMEAVAQAAGVTKRTVYGRYRDKHALFAAVITWALSRWTEPLPDIATDDLEQGLLALGRPMLARALDPDIVKLNRIAMAEAERFPEFARNTQSLTWSPRMRAVMDLLQRHVDAGALRIDDIECAAEHFLSLVTLMPARLAMFGITRSPDLEEDHLRHAVSLFLHGVLPRGNGRCCSCTACFRAETVARRPDLACSATVAVWTAGCYKVRCATARERTHEPQWWMRCHISSRVPAKLCMCAILGQTNRSTEFADRYARASPFGSATVSRSPMASRTGTVTAAASGATTPGVSTDAVTPRG
jgi:AcrR family transcriptional regulator